ncbi:MAG: hypothetical protein LBI82_06985 [Dysgonamonadaceae bacterium]|jgi:hypothetical protein|nr:hypothetical protein [Dysgonamonadaceae bacterium]
MDKLDTIFRILPNSYNRLYPHCNCEIRFDHDAKIAIYNFLEKRYYDGIIDDFASVLITNIGPVPTPVLVIQKLDIVLIVNKFEIYKGFATKVKTII